MIGSASIKGMGGSLSSQTAMTLTGYGFGVEYLGAGLRGECLSGSAQKSQHPTPGPRVWIASR